MTAAAQSAAIKAVLAGESVPSENLSPDVEAQARGLGRAVADKIAAYALQQGWVTKADLPERPVETKPVKTKPRKTASRRREAKRGNRSARHNSLRCLREKPTRQLVRERAGDHRSRHPRRTRRCKIWRLHPSFSPSAVSIFTKPFRSSAAATAAASNSASTLD